MATAPAAVARPASAPSPATAARPRYGDGVFETVDQCIAAARAAFEALVRRYGGAVLAVVEEIPADQQPAILVTEGGGEESEAAWTFRFLVPTLLAVSGRLDKRMFGEPVPVMKLDLEPDTRLAQAEAPRVIAALAKEGYFLQLPPDTPVEELLNRNFG